MAVPRPAGTKGGGLSFVEYWSLWLFSCVFLCVVVAGTGYLQQNISFSLLPLCSPVSKKRGLCNSCHALHCMAERKRRLRTPPIGSVGAQKKRKLNSASAQPQLLQGLKECDAALLPEIYYPSTVFLCETGPGELTVSCDFAHCSQHSTSSRQWMPNTPEAVEYLAKHVEEEIDIFCAERLRNHTASGVGGNGTFFRRPSELLPPISTDVSALLCVFELADRSSSFGWMGPFVEATHSLDVLALSLPFFSRKSLFLVGDDESCAFCEIDAVPHRVSIPFAKPSPRCKDLCRALLSLAHTHQIKARFLHTLRFRTGLTAFQVFSCTPRYLSQAYGFEEFCALADFVRGVQDAFRAYSGPLLGIHLSACFLMKLNETHVDWPVPLSW